MKVSVFGLGYVGAVTATCVAEQGHEVLGVDVNRDKVEMINNGIAPIVEPEFQERIAGVTADGCLRATADGRRAVLESDLSLICVGTPVNDSGVVALDALDNVVTEIGMALRAKKTAHAVAVRSTVPPGTTANRVAPALHAASGRQIGKEVDLCYNPEFLREGSAFHDFFHPPFTVIGGMGEAEPVLLNELYSSIAAPLIRTTCDIAEAVKTVSNTFHALKIAFANEIGSLLKVSGVDGRQVMEIFCQDRKLNISAAYLRPGFAFGGSCLPKDVRALARLGVSGTGRLPLLECILASNEAHIDRAYRLITDNGRRTVALFGIAFKSGTDDLRESPLVALAERLIGRGYPLRIFDPDVEISRLTGKNRAFIDREIPHLEALMVGSPAAALDGADVIVIGHAGPDEIAEIVSGHADRPIVDLQGTKIPQILGSQNYVGICW
ncbi:MAG TPA: nucleotide sugar dehydrogenase [Acetobacteraceae bacterium]|nr:nucleotide sugar dehydrogenase [Acetobacteraceae bacterium]